MIKIIDSFSPHYDEKALHPLQSWAWGEARKQMGIEVLRIEEFNVYQITFHKVPFTNYKIGYLPRSVFPSKEVLKFLSKYGKENKVIFIKIEPYEEKSQITNKFQTSNSKLIKSRHPLFPEWTIILDIAKSEEDLLKQMHSKTRYNIRLAQKKGIVVKEVFNSQGFEIFSRLYFDTCKRQKYFGHSKKYHQIVWNYLKNNIAHILVAYYKDVPLAAYELFFFKKTIYYPYGGSSTEYRNFMSANLLMWEAIKFGQKLGAEKFDFWGSLSPDYQPNHPWAGFTRFKQGYGGKFNQFIGSYDLVINPLLYRLYNNFHQLRQLYLKLKRTL